jgi:hypothetical protein
MKQWDQWIYNIKIHHKVLKRYKLIAKNKTDIVPLYTFVVNFVRLHV